MSGFFLDDIEIGDKSQRAVNAINDIIGCLRPAENYINQICEKINQLGLSNIRFDSQKRFYDDMEEAASKISAYNRITEEYNNDVDRKFSDKYSDVVSELSRIKVKDITIKNNLGITEIRNTNGYRYPVEKAEITLEDLLSYGEFGDIIKESYEGYCERIELSDEEDIYTFDKYVEAISEIGEFEDPKILEKKRNISALLDLLPGVGSVKVLIEVISGENLITHEKLSFLERVIAGVSLIPIGAIAKWLKGVFKGGINSLLRRAGKSAITDIGEEVTEAVIKDEVRGLENKIALEVTEDVVRETVEEIGEVEGREVVESVIKEVNESGKYSSLRDFMLPEEVARYDEHWLNVAENISNEALDNHIKYIKNGGITRQNGKIYEPSKVCCAVDLNTGKTYIGYSGKRGMNPSKPVNGQLESELQIRVDRTKEIAKNTIGNPYAERSSFYTYPVDNCAEVFATNNALLGGADIDNIFLNTRNFWSEDYAPLCDNCKITFENFKLPKNK